jgi:hypothetical protein
LLHSTDKGQKKMANKPHQFTTPVGRLVAGSIAEPRTTDYEGQPLVVKTGANKGQPRQDYSFGIAIPKTPGCVHWAQEPWGQPIYALAQQEFPNGEFNHPTFAWKIQDGDSQIPNRRQIKPCDREGWPGHWVMFFSGSSQPRTYNKDGSQQIPADSIKPGYFVQVFGNVTDNKPSQTPGLYINHSMVALTAYGEEIKFGPDVSAAGFGQGVNLPPGASVTPPATFTPPALPGAPATPPAYPAPVASVSQPLPPNVTPNPAILQVPGGIAPIPPAAPAKVMTALANGMPYEDWIKAGWTDTLLIQHGYMTA